MNVLVVVAHPDDELLGCGGTIRRLANEGHDVYTAVLCATADARHNRPDDLEDVAAASSRMVGVRESMLFDFKNIQLNAVPHLEVVKAIESAIEKFRPEWVFAHHPGDLNIDHKVCHETTMAAIRLPQRLSRDLPPTMIRKVFLFEVLSSTDWGSPIDEPFRPNAFFDISTTLRDKISALENFKGALRPFPHSCSREAVEHLARLRGAQAGIEAAEAFTVVRDLYI